MVIFHSYVKLPEGTLSLFNVSMENQWKSHLFVGQPSFLSSISMGYGFHSYVQPPEATVRWFSLCRTWSWGNFTLRSYGHPLAQETSGNGPAVNGKRSKKPPEKDRKSLPFRKGRKNPKDLICSKIFEGLLGIVKHLWRFFEGLLIVFLFGKDVKENESGVSGAFPVSHIGFNL